MFYFIYLIFRKVNRSMTLSCVLCSKPTNIDDVICCSLCNKPYHPIKCLGLTRSTINTLANISNLKWFCDVCNDTTFVNIVTKKFQDMTDSNDVNFNALVKKLDEIGSVNDSQDKVDRYDDLLTKIEILSTEISNIKSIVTEQPGAMKRKRNASFKLNIQDSINVDDDDGPPTVRPKLTPRINTISGTGDGIQLDENSDIKIIENPEWYHVSQFDPNTDNVKMREWFMKILDAEDIQCVKLVPKGRQISELSFVSFKLGVHSSLVTKVMNPATWPKGISIRPFQRRNGMSTPRVFRF